MTPTFDERREDVIPTALHRADNLAEQVDHEHLTQLVSHLGAESQASLLESARNALADVSIPADYASASTALRPDRLDLLVPLPDVEPSGRISVSALQPVDYSDLAETLSRPTLDARLFMELMHRTVKDTCAGYAIELRRHGQTEHTLIWNWARRPQDGDVGWTVDRQMHVASVSKLLTAWVTSHALVSRGLSPDTAIGPYLPEYWPQGPGAGQVTFRQLFTHRSGFPDKESACDFTTLKDVVAAGSNGRGEWFYQNSNFGLCRVLLATLSGAIAPSWKLDDMAGFFGTPTRAMTDAVWDNISRTTYVGAVESLLFAPAGVTSALTGSPQNALGYRMPISGDPGFDSGDISPHVAGVGWHLSVTDLLNILRVMRTGRGGLTRTQATTLLESGFGVDGSLARPGGSLYWKGGWWEDARGVEQAQVFFLPDDRELVALANSDWAGENLASAIINCYAAALNE